MRLLNLHRLLKTAAAALTVAAVGLFASCSEKPEKGGDGAIASVKIYDKGGAPLSSLSFTAASSSESFSVIATADWELSVEPSGEWLSASPSKGTAGQRIITVEVLANQDTGEPRQGKIVFTSGGKQLASLSVSQEKGNGGETPVIKDLPEADLLDIRFNADNTASDVSKSRHEILALKGPLAVNFESPVPGVQYAAHFSNETGLTVTDSYYRFDYSSDTDFQNRLADGHSIEVLFKLEEANSGAAEIKMFSSTQSGGVAMMISKADRGADITFLPNVSTTGKSNWIWTQSGISPEPGRYYHVVGVWNKSEGRSYIYVDGVLKGTQNASGDFVFPSSTNSFWFAVGGDPNSSGGCESSFKGDVALARIFDSPLAKKDVEKLYEAVRMENPCVESNKVRNLLLQYEAKVFDKCKFHIYGEGFSSGDRIVLEKAETASESIRTETSVASGEAVSTLLEQYGSGEYRVFLERGAVRQPIASTVLTFSDDAEQVTVPKVIAHRGYHKAGHPHNSIAALKAAQELGGVYAVELDVWITNDGIAMVNHDSKYPGDSHVIETSSYDELSSVTLSNGEPAPTLEAFLDQAAKDGNTGLIVEIKSHSSEENTFRAVDESIRLVKEKGLESRTGYIAFSYNACKRIAAAYPEYNVQYLGGNVSPEKVKSDGLKGIDYSASVLTNNPGWIGEAHSLGLEVNVWTVNTQAQMMQFINAGVDYITTDDPPALKELNGKPFVTR
ncbi:MAG: glycerophosphodiester phosphodiesterase family protein [Candidatus Cryptobacteroides sp.]